MLDKSVPHHDIIMKLSAADARAAQTALPPGFTCRLYASPSDADAWAQTEASVLEFCGAADARAYFDRVFAPHEEQLKQRMVFVCNARGTPVANAALWREPSEGGLYPSLHWVAVRPPYQGLRLGRAVVEQTLALAPRLAPGEDIYLHTQTWSHKAVWLYHTLGFRVLRRATFGRSRTEYDGMMCVLRGLWSQARCAALEEVAVDG